MSETITSTVEDYLGLIYIMQREGQSVIGARLAERLGVSRPTVTATLQRMMRVGLIAMDEQKEISLTPQGLEVAQDVLRRHMLAEWLLQEVLGLPWYQIHEEADRLEHHFSEEAVARMETLFERPQTCPHGNPMPGALPTPAVTLDQVEEGVWVTVVRVVEEAEEQPDLLAFLAEQGLLPGARLHVLAHRPYNKAVAVEVIGDSKEAARPVVLGLSVARHVRVCPSE